MKSKGWHLLVYGLIGLTIAYAIGIRHVDDDAFITFRYSRNLVGGLGPVWNFDQRVEGYTNFLWMLVMAAPIGLGFDPVLPSMTLSLIFLGLNLWMLFRCVDCLTNNKTAAFIIWLPLLFNRTMVAFSTSGMETAFNGFIWTLALWQFLRIIKAQQLKSNIPIVLIGITLGLAVLSRPEGTLLALISGVSLIFWMRKKRQLSLASLALGFASFLALVMPWLVWKVLYYGYLLPNTFYAKTTSVSWLDGGYYILALFAFAGFWIPLLLAKWGKPAFQFLQGHFQATVGLLVFLFSAYLFLVGGDYLEFRLAFPVLPWLILGPALILWHSRKNLKFNRIASVLMVMLFLFHGFAHGRWYHLKFIQPAARKVMPGAHFMSFQDQGKSLGAMLDYDETIRFAIGSVGAIPYYSRFYGVDLYGLNEPHSEFRSIATGFAPGHGRHADLPYVLERNTHLVSLRCDYLPSLPRDRHYTATDPAIALAIKGHEDLAERHGLQVIELPLSDEFAEVCLYLHPHPRIDSLIAGKAIELRPVGFAVPY